MGALGDAPTLEALRPETTPLDGEPSLMPNFLRRHHDEEEPTED